MTIHVRRARGLFRARLRRRPFAILAMAAAMSSAPVTGSESAAPAPRPHFGNTAEQVQLELPPGKRLGSVVAVSIAPNGDMFLLHDVVWALEPIPIGAQLPPVVHLTADGKFIAAWGGPDQLPKINGMSQWPVGLDNLEVDADGNVWVFGYNEDDDGAAKFTADGKFISQIGARGRHGDITSTDHLNGPVSVFLDKKSRELFIADGYGNNRVISFHADTGKFLRTWGAYGKEPAPVTPPEKRTYGAALTDLPPPPPTFDSPVHKIIGTPDGKLYAADRKNNRVQEFERGPNGVQYAREVELAPGTAGGTAWDINFSPDYKYMYVADAMNMRIWIVDRASFKVLGWSSSAPDDEGNNNLSADRSGSHRIAVQPNGDLLIARTTLGLQHIKFTGIR